MQQFYQDLENISVLKGEEEEEEDSTGNGNVNPCMNRKPQVVMSCLTSSSLFSELFIRWICEINPNYHVCLATITSTLLNMAVLGVYSRKASANKIPVSCVYGDLFVTSMYCVFWLETIIKVKGEAVAKEKRRWSSFHLIYQCFLKKHRFWDERR